ncbi:hypothetical protein [Rhizobium sp. ZPR3]|uniref:Uncharacterized protein n=2 Tax=unclassified Rhizobium TaxID=2613769 RepID=A0AAU7SHH3_9HYPH
MNRHNIQISSQTASILSDVGMMKDEKTKAATTGAAIGNSNSLNSSSSSLQSSLAASALDKAASGMEFRYSGPNLAAVTATDQWAKECGLSGGYDLNEILTDQDKAVSGFDPNDLTPNAAAMALADARYSGRLNGDISSEFISSLQNYYDLSDATIQGMQDRFNNLVNNTSE